MLHRHSQEKHLKPRKALQHEIKPRYHIVQFLTV